MKSLILALAAFLLPQGSSAASRITLGEYLTQVENRSPGMAAARLASEGGERRAGGAKVLSFPYLFGNLNTYKDQAETAFPIQQGTETQGTIYTLGLGMNTVFGLNGKYSWNTSYAETLGVPLATAGRYTSYNKLDVTLNLSRNGFGSEIRAKKELIASGNVAESLVGKFEQVSHLAEAEVAYWRLAAARQSVLLQKEVVKRAEKLLEWARKRVSNQLGDRSDLLQAQASHDLQNLQLTSSVEEERNAARAFNLLRKFEGESVPEAVGLPTIEETLKMAAPEREGERLDIQAATERMHVAQAKQQLDKEALKPNVDLIATYAWNGREPERSTAISEAWGARHPSRSIGIVFAVPLNAPTWMSALNGADQGIEQASLELEQARLSDDKNWRELSQRLTIARSRLALTQTLERVQREKSDHEQERLLRGRSTTYQALSFEQDFAQAQLLRLRTQSEVLQLLAQMRTYRGSL